MTKKTVIAAVCAAAVIAAAGGYFLLNGNGNKNGTSPGSGMAGPGGAKGHGTNTRS